MRPALLLIVTLVACTPRVTQVGSLDGGPPTITLTGKVCAPAPDPTGFPTKVILVVDQSGSMCVTDPPGSQPVAGFCEMYGGSGTSPKAARIRALEALASRLSQSPTTTVALVPYDTNVRTVWPAPNTGARTARPDSTFIAAIDQLQSTLGKGSDLQGALAYTRQLIEDDVRITELTTPQAVSRTRYVVVLITDGVPFPRCSEDDTRLIYADDTHPELIWPDSTGAGTFCNSVTPNDPDAITGFIAGTDRNQNAQLFAEVDDLMTFARQHHVGSMQVHTSLLFNSDAITACGPICSDLYGTYSRYPGTGVVPVPANEQVAFARSTAKWLLDQLSRHGNGVTQEFHNAAGLANLSYLAFEYGSLASPNALKRLFVRPLSSVAEAGQWVPDTDGDGLSDSLELAEGLSVDLVDTDGDGFGDAFERRSTAQRFDPLLRDLRGCDPVSPATPGCTVQDPDGDGLSQYAEAMRGTSPIVVDSDRDGLPDGLETQLGLDPLDPLVSTTDTDADGISDLLEMQAGSDPLRADRTFWESAGIRMVVDEEAQEDGSLCYAFTATRLPLPDTSARPVAPSLFQVWFASAPRGSTDDVGNWKTACAWVTDNGAQFDPSDLIRSVTDTDFHSPSQVSLGTPSARRTAPCAGTRPPP